jgi:hypothetical protein
MVQGGSEEATTEPRRPSITLLPLDPRVRAAADSEALFIGQAEALISGENALWLIAAGQTEWRNA